jgi:hypothetical protein
MQTKNVKLVVGTDKEVREELEAFQFLMTMRGSADWSVTAPAIAFAPDGTVMLAVTLTWVTDLTNAVDDPA